MVDALILGDTPEEFEEQDDGSILIPDDSIQDEEPSTFDINLADEISDKALKSIAMELCELVDRDKRSREKRDKQYEEGLRRTGLGDDAPGGAEFAGASKVVHPVLAEACVDFSARAVKELFPAIGPVKPYIAGEVSTQKRDQGIRKARFLNWQLTKQMAGYRDELEQLLTQLPMGGSQFLKFWYDQRLARPACAFVPVDELYLPYSATSFETAPRFSHRQLVTKYEFHRRVKSGLYRDVFTPSPGSTPEQSLTSEANDKIEGREEDGYNEDGLRPILEIYVNYELDDDELVDDNSAPYIITIDEDTEQVLSIYRNWEEADPLMLELDWFVEFKFIPWRGAYGIGLPHLIGGLSAALTGALRALLDSAHINNAPTMLKLRSGRVVGQSKQIDVTQVCDIEGPAGIDDIRKLAMAMPFNQPSPVLAQLLGELNGLAKGVVATADEKLASVGDRTPVGTTMSLIEQGSTIYSAIHARLHASQARALAILQRIDHDYFPELDFNGYDQNSINAEDFAQTGDVIPVSDPTIFSESQRFAQVQSLVQMSSDQSVPWNKINLYHRVMKQMRIEAPDEILPKPPEPVTADAMTENVAALQQGMMLKAAMQQNHLLHIQSHMAAMSVPWVLENQLVPVQALQAMLSHINEHLQQYVTTFIGTLAQQMMMQGQATGAQVDPETLAAQAQAQALPMLTPQIAPFQQKIAQLMETVQKRVPPPQFPPEVQASIQIAQMEIERKKAADQMQVQTKTQELGVKQQNSQASLGIDQQKQSFEQQIAQAKLALEQQKAQAQQTLKGAQMAQEAEIERLKQEVELLKNEQDNRQKAVTEVAKNDDDNETNILINEAKNEAAKERLVLGKQLDHSFDMMRDVLNPPSKE